MGTVTTTASVGVFPTAQDVNRNDAFGYLGAVADGKTLAELPLSLMWKLHPWHGYSYVSSGGAYTLVSGRTFRHSTFRAMINGYVVEGKSTPETLTCEASSTCYTWLQLVRNSAEQVTGARWVVTTTASVPSLPTYGIAGDQVMFGQVTAGASTITSQYDTHRGIIMPGAQVNRGGTACKSYMTGTSSAGNGDKLTVDVMGDGVTPMRVSLRGYVASSGTGPLGNGLAVYTGANASGTLVAGKRIYEPAAVVSGADGSLEATDVMAAWIGIRTLYLYAYSSVGNPTLYGNQPQAGRAGFTVEFATDGT